VSRLVDVAAKAGVSKSTVSNVIRGTALVAEETRRRVERAIADTDYRPNAIARALQARSGNVLGIIVPDLTNPFYAQLAVGVERAAAALGFAILTAHTECVAASEIAAAHALIERRVGGAVIGGMSLNSPLPKLLLNHDIPVTLAALGEIDDARPGVVEQDEAAAMEEVVAHLHGLGHRHIAFVAHALIEHAGERRRIGFLQAMRRRDLVPVAEKDATALVAHDDMRAIDAIDRLERAGRRVPSDISVTGYDDVPMASHDRIRLTTIRSDAVDMGYRAASLVAEAARHSRHVARRELMPSLLIVRGSTSAPPA
jgi:LacI family transcriptional regulator